MPERRLLLGGVVLGVLAVVVQLWRGGLWCGLAFFYVPFLLLYFEDGEGVEGVVSEVSLLLVDSWGE